MSVVIFASDAKGTSSVSSTISELEYRKVPYFAMVSQKTQLQYPGNLENFQLYSNTAVKDQKNPSRTLGLYLPFKPEWLIIQRERWEPESSIIEEFKEVYGCNIGLIEPNAQILNNAETILETYSRNRFVPYIDVFFDHSRHIVEQRKLVGFQGNSIVTGNPKYDRNLKVPPIAIQTFKNHYAVDDSKKQVLLYSLINGVRPKLMERFKEIVEEKKDTHQFFYKPYPGEPFDSKFRSEYSPKFALDNVTPILEESHIWGMFHVCDLHIGCLSSIFYAPLRLGKEIIDLSSDLGVPAAYLDKERILKNKGNGIEESTQLWMRSFGFKEIRQLESLLPDDLFGEIKQKNNIVWNRKDNLISLFDSYNDSKAATRIVNYITTK